mgnify:CR=1 FL=1
MKLYISGRISGRPAKLAQAEFGEIEDIRDKLEL